MKASLRSFLFPDVNVWLAFVYERHIHHSSAFAWFSALKDEDRACFSRFTQVSLLRLLTTEAVMRTDVMSQIQAWSACDRLLEDGRIVLIDEPAGTEPGFRALSQSKRSSTKEWADAYIAAFAKAARMTLVTFDRGLNARVKDAILIQP
jgi:toxin-antitoxin system PIN domain toxin